MAQAVAETTRAGRPPRPEKVQAVAELVEKLQQAPAVLVTDFRGLDVKAMTRLRRRLREAGAEHLVVKNTLARLALRRAGSEALEAVLEGPCALTFAYGDPVAVAKVFSEFAREHRTFMARGGLLQGRLISAEAVRSLADLPSREVLLGQVLRGMQAPVAGLVFGLAGILRQLLYALDAVRRQREEAA